MMSRMLSFRSIRSMSASRPDACRARSIPGPLRRVVAGVAGLSLVVPLLLPMVAAPAFASGKEPKKRVAIIDFDNKAGRNWFQGVQDPGRALAEKLIEALIGSEKFIVLERDELAAVLAEQNLDNVAMVEPDVVGRLTRAQCLIRATVTEIEELRSDKGRVGLRRLGLGGNRSKVRVKINLRVIDVTTSQVIESRTVTGTAGRRGLSLRGALKGVNSSYETEQKLPLGDAIDDAIAQAVDLIVSGMERIPWQGSLSRVSGREVIINAGAQENVEPGLQLRVFERGPEVIDKDTNESLGHLDEEVGVIRVREVQGRFSIAEIVQGSGFSPGNIVRPLVGPY